MTRGGEIGESTNFLKENTGVGINLRPFGRHFIEILVFYRPRGSISPHPLVCVPSNKF